MPVLFHVSDGEPLVVLVPRPSPAGTAQAGRALVWAVDGEHLAHYLLPRDCPRVCWATSGADGPLLASPARRVIAVEHAWAGRLTGMGLLVHELDPTGFTLLDAGAGYWVTPGRAEVRSSTAVDDAYGALAARDVELRLTPTLWPYVDAVVAGADEFSAIRMRNARPREG